MAYLAYDGQTVVVVLYHGLNAVRSPRDDRIWASIEFLLSSQDKESRKHDSHNFSLVIVFIQFVRARP